jgi:antitoxin YefM
MTMAVDVTYTEARANLAKLWDEAIDTREPIVIRRRGKENVVIIAADELAGLVETAHLLRSPHNAERLLKALARSRTGEPLPQSIVSLKKEMGLGE